MPTKIIKATATLDPQGDQPFVIVNDGPNNSGTFSITLNDPTTGETISTLAHLADSFDDAKVKYFLTLPPDQLPGKVIVCTAVLKRVGSPGPIIFELHVVQNGQAVDDDKAKASYANDNLATVAFRVALK